MMTDKYPKTYHSSKNNNYTAQRWKNTYQYNKYSSRRWNSQTPRRTTTYSKFKWFLNDRQKFSNQFNHG